MSDASIDYLSIDDLLEIASGVIGEVAVRDPGLLAAAAARYQPDLPQKHALEIVQKLHDYAVQFKLFPKEKA